MGNSPNQILEITDESIHITLSGGFVNDILVVVVAKATAQFLVVHLWFILTDTPATCNLKTKRNEE